MPLRRWTSRRPARSALSGSSSPPESRVVYPCLTLLQDLHNGPATKSDARHLYARKWDSEAERAAALKTWNRHYNYHRPHGAHDGQPPASATPARVNNVMASYN
ncbi:MULTISPECIES: integrase core domain-containing protein [unclassified Kocuria]|uniref:integrase core domain-containing protein n=1 Tax=unclassified Kocuria TaxID=2649579 RepID=UPI0037C048AC